MLTIQRFAPLLLPVTSAFAGSTDRCIQNEFRANGLPLQYDFDFRSLPDNSRHRIIVPGSLPTARLAGPYNLLEPRPECLEMRL